MVIFKRSAILFVLAFLFVTGQINAQSSLPIVYQVKDIALSAADMNSSTEVLHSAGNQVYLLADDNIHGQELWHTDGTASGATLLKDINPGPFGSNVTQFAVGFNGLMFFVANDGLHGPELWKTDGSPAGTLLLKDINPMTGNEPFPNPYNEPQPALLGSLNNTLLLAVDDGLYGAELWVSDGSSEGTVLLKDINFGPDGSGIKYPLLWNNSLYFFANDGLHGEELWRSDGTAGGTVLVKDINLGSAAAIGSVNQPGLAVVNNTLLFRADDGSHGPELWRSDGTAAGTVLVNDINPGSEGS